MSGGHFDYNQFKLGHIADVIESEILNSGKEIPEDERWADKDWYNKYPKEGYYPKYTEETIRQFTEAIRLLRLAEIYTHRVDWLLSGDDGEDSFNERLANDLKTVT